MPAPMPPIAIGDKLGGKGTVALTQGASNDTENAMSDAFRKTIAAKYPGIKVLDTQMEGFEPSAAEAKAVAILQGNPDVTAAFGDHRQQHPDLVGCGPQGRARCRHHRHGLYPAEPRSGEIGRRLRHRCAAAL